MNRTEVTPNLPMHRSANSWLRRLLPPGDWSRWASRNGGEGLPMNTWMSATLRAMALALVLCAGFPVGAGDALAKKSVRIAYVSPGSAQSAGSTRLLAAFRERLRDLGWVQGEDLVIDEYWTEGHMERLPELMAKALMLHPDVVVTGSTPGALAAKKATTNVPIVVAAMGDPVQTGVVSNLARPGGNITALSTGFADGFAGKWLELLAEVVPQATTVAVIWNLGNPVVRTFDDDLRKAALARGLKLHFIDVREPRLLDDAFKQAKQAAQAAVIVCETMFISNQRLTADLAAKYKMPAIECLPGFARVGGLMTYGVDLRAMYRRAAEYVDKILRGASAGDLPVEQPTKFELVVNLKAARALGVSVPDSVLVRADEVIR